MKTPEFGLSTIDTKLRPPMQRRGLIRRPQLDERIDGFLGRRLLLLSAPAGYGKTTALVQLYERLSAQGRQSAWISLDSADNDLIRFAAHLVDAISRAGISPRRGLEALLGAGANAQHGIGAGPSPALLKKEILNELAGLKEDLYLFLDDLHLITEPVVIDLVSALLLSSLEYLHVVVATRDQSNLPAARLRALGEIHELDAGVLAFSSNEANEFLRASGGPTLSASQLDQLTRQTEGWVASLQMASIALLNSTDPESFLQQFSGNDRSVADFLIEEVLKLQPPEIQEFLLATSILRRFNCGLANAVLGRRDSRNMVDRIESLNLFIFSLDRDRNWYRYHHLFADLLKSRLLERHPDRVEEYQRRACDWLSKNGLIIDAIDHAFSAGDIQRAGLLVDEASSAMFANGQTATLQEYVSRLPVELLRSLPRLQLEMAWEDVIRWKYDAARAALDDVRQYLDSRRDAASTSMPVTLTEAQAAILRSKLAHRQVMYDVFTDNLEAAQSGAKAWISAHGNLDPFMSASLGTVLMLTRRNSFDCEMTHADWDLLRAQFLQAHAVYGTVFLDTVVGAGLFMRSETPLALDALVRGRRTAILMHGENTELASMPSAQLALIYYEQDHIIDAKQISEESRELGLDFGLLDSTIARQIVAARLARVAGYDQQAHLELDRLTRLADRHGLRRAHASVLLERVNHLIADGQYREATQLASDPRYRNELESVLPVGQADTARLNFALAKARLSGESGELQQNITVLRRWLNWTRDRRCNYPATQVLVSLCRLYLRGGDALGARRSAIDALRLAAPGDFKRSFIDAGPEVLSVLEQLLASNPGPETCSKEFLSQILKAAGRKSEPGIQGAATSLLASFEESASLSEREIEVIRLAASNMVSHEIADAMGLSEATIKWYWRKIFEKLGVRRRTVAVRAARQMGLIK